MPRSEYVRLAVRLLDLFPPKEGVDPQAFQVAIASVLTHYPYEIIKIISDPFDGLPAKQPWSPTPYDVKKFCEGVMADHWKRADRAKRVNAQIEAQVDRTGRPSLTEIEDEMAERGVPMRGYVERFCRTHVITEREFWRRREEHERKGQDQDRASLQAARDGDGG